MSKEQITEIQKLLSEEKFYPARKLILQLLVANPTNRELWLHLATSFAGQGYLYDAYEIFHYIRLFEPRTKWLTERIQAISLILDQSKPKKMNFRELLQLKSTTVAVSMIVKNERKNIDRWYNSIIGKVDEIIIVDTGSTDGTREYIEQLEHVKVIDYVWNDNFAEARNVALPFIKSDWVLWIDGDEYLDEIEQQLDSIHFVASYYETLQQYPILSIVQVNLNNGQETPTYEQYRMFSTKRNLHYIGRIHEQIVEKGHSMYEHSFMLHSGIRLIHDGYEKTIVNDKKKLERNIQLLKLEIEQNSENPFWWLLLGRETRISGNLEESIRYLEIAKEKVKKEPHFGRILEIYDNLAIAYLQLNQLEEVEKIAEHMLTINSKFPNAHYYINVARVEKSLLTIQNAYNNLDSIKQSFYHNESGISADESIYNWRADLLKANILRFTGYLSEAYQIYQQIQSNYPQNGINEQLTFIEQQFKQLNESIKGMV